MAGCLQTRWQCILGLKLKTFVADHEMQSRYLVVQSEKRETRQSQCYKVWVKADVNCVDALPACIIDIIVSQSE